VEGAGVAGGREGGSKGVDDAGVAWVVGGQEKGRSAAGKDQVRSSCRVRLG
jgi:hypothetical protein